MNLPVPPRVLVADDHARARDLIARLLRPGHEIVGFAGDVPDLLEAEERLHPDLLVVDVDMPGRSGLDAIRDLRARNCSAAIVVVTVDEDPGLVRRALGVGAQGFVTKSRMAQDLCAAATAALGGTPFVSPQIPDSGHAPESRPDSREGGERA